MLEDKTKVLGGSSGTDGDLNPYSKPRSRPGKCSKAALALFATAKKSFCCQICRQSFSTKLEIQRHFYHRHRFKAQKLFPGFEDKNFKCLRCHVSFSTNDQLVSHLQSKHKKEEFKRVELEPLFPGDKPDLPQWYLRCHVCDESFSSRDLLMEHIRAHHMKSVAYTCDPCQLGFASYALWTNHNYYEHPTNNYEESSSAITYSHVADPNEVQITDKFHPSTEFAVVQDLYTPNANSESVVTFSENCPVDLTSQTGILHKCPFCTFSRNESSSVIMHMKKAHLIHESKLDLQNYSGSTLFPCCYCQLHFVSDADLHDHINSVHHHSQNHPPPLQPEPEPEQRYEAQPQVQEMYECSACKLQATDIKSLSSHMKEKHGMTPRLQCPMCYNTYADKRGLQKHFQKHHSSK